MNRFIFLFIALGIALLSCSEKRQLPIYGERKLASKTIGGTPDTIFSTIPDFSFTNQFGHRVTASTFENKIYIADFFFTRCPSICPIMKRQMIRVYEAYKGNAKVGLLSHTIDPTHDSVAVLKKYADDLGVVGEQWNFVTGKQEDIYTMAQKGYILPAEYGTGLPKDINHSGHFVLVDTKRRIRGYYLGTDEKSVTQLIEDIGVLLQETGE